MHNAAFKKHHRDTERKRETIRGEKEKKKKNTRLFSHTIIESSLPKSSTKDNWAQQVKKKKHLSKYLQHKSFPFIYQALTKPYCTLSRPTPSDPPTHICDSLTLQFTTCRDGRGRDSIWITTQICEWFIVLKTMGRFSATPLFLSITPIGRPWTITVWTN